MKTLVIGDIHGCYAELLDLLERAGLSDDDAVIALGDVVDRGTESPEVYGWFRADARRRSLLGNHERKHVRWHAGQVRPALSQRITRHQLGSEWADAVAWMAGLPWSLDLPEALLVHGMFEPEVALEQQREQVLTGTLSGEAHLRRQGYPRPWYELYRGVKPLLVGHQNLTGTTEPYIRGDQLVYGLDTGCATGGKLTGLLLPEFRIVAVRSRFDHWARVRAVFGPLVATPPPIHKLSFDDLERLLAGGAEAADSAEQYQAWQVLRTAADAAVDAILAHVETEYRAIEALREADPPEPAESTYVRRFAHRIAAAELRPLLHLRRRGLLDGERLRRHLHKPAAAVAFAARLAQRP